MYPYDIDPRSYINSALALQTPTGAGMPQMTPASHGYYGPTHQALADTLAAALARQASNAGLFAPAATPGVSGGLMAPAGIAPSASFFRMPSDFSKPVYTPPVSAAAAPSTGMSNTAQGLSGGNGGQADHSNTYTADTSRTNPDNPNAIGNSQGTYSLGLPADNPHIDPITGLMTGIGNIFSGLFSGLQQPTSIDATGTDTKTGGVAPTFAPASAPTYRLSTNDMMPGIGVQPSITGTPLAPPSNDMMPGIGAQPSITGTDIGTPMQEPSQTLNGLLMGNYEPVTGYANNFSRLTAADLSTPPTDNKIQDRIISAEDMQNNSAATRQQAEQAAAQEAANIAELQAADRSGGGGNYGLGNSPDSGYGANNGGVSTGGESASARSDGAWRMGGLVPKYGDGPPKAVHGTVHEGEYVIRPESVKLLPPGLLSALNDIYKSSNPKKTLRGLLG